MKRSMSVSHVSSRSAIYAQPRSVTLTLLVFGMVMSLLLSACRPNGAIRLTPGTPLPTPKESPTPAPTWTPAPSRLEPFIALCLVKTTANTANFYTSPDETSAVLRPVKNREVLTVTVRSLDQNWVRGQSKDELTGWIQTQSVACTVPIHELYVAKETGTILDVTATAAVVASATALVAGTPTTLPEPTSTSLAATALAATALAATATSTLTPRPSPSPSATPTTIPPTATHTPQPTMTATPTSLPEIECTVVITKGLNVRIGPSTEFRAFVKLAENDTFVAVGRNADGTWLAGRAPGNRPGWVIVTSLRCAADYMQLAVVPNDVVLQQITPTPAEIATATLTVAPIPATPTVAPIAATPTVALITATPTSPVATQKPAATGTLTVTLPAKATATVAVPTGVPGLQCSVVVSTGVYLRTGPARTFPAQVVAHQGEIFIALGRSANNVWLLGRNEKGVVGWSIAGGIRCSVSIRTLPVSRQIQPSKTLVP